MSDGNGKKGGLVDALRPLDGQKLLFIEPVPISDDLAKAIDWLKHGGDNGRHRPGCQCTPCINALRITLSKLIGVECTCGWCPICWAAAELQARRL